MDNITVDIHAIHTFGPSLINRDDVGAPKTATYGGTLRQRVSSAAFKRAIRLHAANNPDTRFVGIRSKRITRRLADALAGAGDNAGMWAHERVRRDVAIVALTAAGLGDTDPAIGTGKGKDAKIKIENFDKWDAGNPDEVIYPHLKTLVYISEDQLVRLAHSIVNTLTDELELCVEDKDIVGPGLNFEVVTTQTVKSLSKLGEEIFGSNHSADIALFGRMMASNTDLNVDAAAAVAHAISVHPYTAELDFYTAVDDYNTDDHGSAMMGSVQFSSSTFYRYATINMTQLVDSLGDDHEVAVDVVSDFLDSFMKALPSGKQTTFAAYTLPVCALVTVTRNGRPVTLDSAFFKAVDLDGDVEDNAVKRLSERFDEVTQMYSLSPDTAVALTSPGHAEFFGDNVERVTTITEFTTAIRDALSK